jgi:thiol:disulfide interchange protein DsbD
MFRLLFMALLGSALAAEAGVPLKIELVSGVKSVRAGQAFYLALALEHGRGYHTYWKHPGTVGVPTQFQWEALPEGFSVSDILWPEPEATRMFQIKAQGYERDVLLPIRVTAPADLTGRASITFKGKAIWMCCAQECNPGYKELEITLPVASPGPEEVDRRVQARIDQELERQVQESASWAARARVDGSQVLITLVPKEGARAITQAEAEKLVYFTEDGVVDSDKPQRAEVDSDGSLAFHLVKADIIPQGLGAVVRGVLVRPGGWQEDGAVRAMRVAARR